MTDNEKSLDACLCRLGGAVADMFEQLMRGNWRDDHGHDVVLNKQMLDLMAALRHAIDVRAELKLPGTESKP